MGSCQPVVAGEARLRLPTLSSSWLLCLSGGVWSCVAAGLTFSSGCISRLSLLCRALGELSRAAFRLWVHYTQRMSVAEGRSIWLTLSALLQSILLIVIAVVSIALLGIRSVIRGGELVRCGGEAPDCACGWA